MFVIFDGEAQFTIVDEHQRQRDEGNL
jgi:hypothetical protein